MILWFELIEWCPLPLVQDPHSESEIDAKIQQQLVFKFYIAELQNYLQFRCLYTRAFVKQN